MGPTENHEIDVPESFERCEIKGIGDDNTTILAVVIAAGFAGLNFETTKDGSAILRPKTEDQLGYNLPIARPLQESLDTILAQNPLLEISFF